MMKLRLVLGVFGLLWPLTLTATHAQQPGDGGAAARFVAELSGKDGSAEGPLVLNVTFYGEPPPAGQVGQVMRQVLAAAITLEGTRKIDAHAWLSVSKSSTDRQPLLMESGSNVISHEPKDESTSTSDTAEQSGSTDELEPTNADELGQITEDREVKRACENVDSGRFAMMVKLSAEQLGQERKHIVKALRTWCKDNDVAVDRNLRSCMSAISKATSAAGGTGIKVEDLQASIANGTSAFNTGQCGKCHRADGKGGPRGPDLTDDVWDHCDGSIAGIEKVLLSGVPLNKIKDQSRTSAMEPATNLIRDRKLVTDLAIYINSLSKK